MLRVTHLRKSTRPKVKLPTLVDKGKLVCNYSLLNHYSFLHYFFSTFTQNNAADAGAVLAYRFPMRFNGTNLFMENTGGGVALLQARMDITGSIWFENNTALKGGAIKMQEQSVVGCILIDLKCMLT